jgi:hypothetical protein
MIPSNHAEDFVAQGFQVFDHQALLFSRTIYLFKWVTNGVPYTIVDKVARKDKISVFIVRNHGTEFLPLVFHALNRAKMHVRDRVYLNVGPVWKFPDDHIEIAFH